MELLSWQNILWVGIGGFLGSIARFYVNVILTENFPHELPLATLCVNIVGSLIIGILTGLFVYHIPSDGLKLLLTTGFLGGLTTYSTFAIETFILFNSSYFMGILNIFLNLFGSIFAAGLGYKLIIFWLR